jgi:formylglycine-generating enzyme required for sulfatase activity
MSAETAEVGAATAEPALQPPPGEVVTPPEPDAGADWQQEETELVRAAKEAAVGEPEAAPAGVRAPLGIPSVRDEPGRTRGRRSSRRAAETPLIPSLREEVGQESRRKLPGWARLLIGLAVVLVLIAGGVYVAYLFGVLPAALEPVVYGILPPRVVSYDEYLAQAVAEGEITPTPAPTPTPTLTPIPAPSTPAEALPLPANPTAGEQWTRPKDAMRMVFVPDGEFTMGSDAGGADEQPVHLVVLDAFWIDETEVTNTQYRWCVESGECSAPTTCDFGAAPYEDVTLRNHPVVCVDWAGAQAYCEWVGGRLPTEAEWEFAARGPAVSTYPWGDLEPSCDVARYAACEEGTIEVGELSGGASWVGALDMAGNVWEWTGDWYARKFYDGSPGDNPTGPESGTDRALRGGGWYFDERYMRSAGRYKLPPMQRLDYVGFRCVYVP